MPIYAKIGSSTWSTNAKKVWVKASDGWKSATRLFAKTVAGWVQMWPGDAPASSLTDPIDIRLTGYNGPRASSPEYINTVLYGNDGTITGATPITVNSRRMKISEDNTGNTTRYQLETTDVYNLTSNSETNIGFKRFMADGWWLFYELVASNVWSPFPPGTTLYSPAIKIIKQAPTFSANSPSLSQDYSTSNPFFSLSFSFSDTWWKSADLSRSYIRWWRNTSKTPGGTEIKTTYIQDISGLSTTRSGGQYEEYDGQGTTVSGNDYHSEIGGIPAGQYIIAQVVLINSYTDHYGGFVSAFVSTGDKPSITSLTVTDDNGNGVVDNQSPPRIMSDGWLNFTATVSDALSSTYYLLEPRMYNWVNGNTYEFNTANIIGSTSWPTDLGPSSVSLNGTTATVTWRIYIEPTTIYNIGTPTYSGGQARWQFEFRVSARASSTSTNASASYFTGIASLGADTVYMQGLDVPAMVNVHPSSAMTLNVSTTTPTFGSSVTFSGTTVGYPTSTYSSFPRRYLIDYGDGTNSGWQFFSTGTSNPSFSGITKTYSNSGTYIATLKWEPQGDPSRSTRSRVITMGANLAPPTSTSIVSVNRLTDTETRVIVSSSGGSGPYYQMYWQSGSTAPSTTNYDAASTTSTVTEDFSFANGITYYFYIRSSSENLGNTITGGTATGGTYSNYGPTTGAASYTFAQPTGSVSVSPSSGTAGTTQFTANPSVSSAPTANISYQWQFFESATIGWVAISGATSSTYTPPSNYVSLYGASLRCQITANNGVGTTLTTASSTVTVAAAATKLTTPTNVSASDTRTDGIQVSWTNVSNAATYGVWWGGAPSYDSSPDFGGPNNNGGVSITSSPFLDTAAPVGSRTYYVQAFPSTGSTTFLKSDWSAGDSGTRLEALAKLATPTGVNASDTRTDGVNVTWNAVSGAAYYGVWYGGAPGYDSSPDFGGPNNPTLITGTSYLDTAIGAGVTRDYYVQAFRSGNPTGTKSDWGGPNSGTRLALVSIPSGGSVTLNGGNTVGSIITASTSGWSGSPTSYDVYITTALSPNTPTSGSSRVASSGGGTSASYSITSGDAVSPVNVFRAFATASNSAGTSGTVQSSNTITTQAAVTGTAPSTPTGLSNSYSSGPSWTGSWSASSGTATITYFWTLYQSSSNGGAITATASGNTTGTSFTRSMSSANGLWAYFTVFASNSFGTSGTATSPWA
jgi:hypothetical protein